MQSLPETVLIPIRVQRDMIINVGRASCKALVIFARN